MTSVTPAKVKELFESLSGCGVSGWQGKERAKGTDDAFNCSLGVVEKPDHDEHVDKNLPHSRTQFWQRVHSFTKYKLCVWWVNYPELLSPIRFAKFGWKHTVQRDCVECVTCRSVLCVQIPQAWRVGTAAYKSACEEVSRMIIEKHHQHCSWRSAPSPDEVSVLSWKDRSEALADFRLRWEALAAMYRSIPKLSTEIEQEMKITEVEMEKLTELLEKDAESNKETWSNKELRKAITLLALTGWSKSEDKPALELEKVECQCCNRQVATSLFYELLLRRERNSDSQRLIATPPKRRRIGADASDVFHPVNVHSVWCLWSLPSPQMRLLTNNKQRNEESQAETRSVQTSKSLLSNICGFDEHGSNADVTEEEGGEADDEKVAGWRQLMMLLLLEENSTNLDVSLEAKKDPTNVIHNVRKLTSEWAAAAASPPSLASDESEEGAAGASPETVEHMHDDDNLSAAAQEAEEQEPSEPPSPKNQA